MESPQPDHPLELWVGPECTINRVGERWRDQSELTGFARRPEDIDRLASLGATRVRFPVLWERAAATPGPLDFSWAGNALARLQSRGLEPIVGLLHHGSGPRQTSLVDPHFPALFGDYARQVAECFPHVRYWTPINEPLTTARFSCLYGLWYPHAADDETFVRALLNEVRGTVLAMRAIRSVNPEARLLQTDDLGFTRSTPALADQAAFDNERRWLAFDLLCGRVDEQHPLWDWLCACGAREDELEQLREAPCAPEIIGINAYVTSERFLDDRLELHPAHLQGGNGRQVYADVETVRAHGALIDGFGARLRETHARYGLPVAITEVHMGCTREEQLRWLHLAWTSAVQAKCDGVDVRGVTAWAAFGTVDWSSLLTREAGHYEPGLWDIRSNPPRLTALGRFAGALGRGEPADSEAIQAVLESPGWWQRDLRLNVVPHGEVEALAAQGPRLLIVGHGRLAEAFARLSHMRGLPYEWRESVDDLGADALLDVLQSHDIWAVIDTVGRAHAPVARIAGSVRRLVVHVSSSPDSMDQPESDASALHIHTGALFGPWSGPHDVLAAGLACLERGEPWHADTSERVWPTYIPDLVQAALDLLIDGEVGAWHLTHGESMSWWDFARRVARLGERDASLVQPIRTVVPAPVGAVRAAGWPRLLPSLDDALSRYGNDHEPEPAGPLPLRGRDSGRSAVRRSKAHLAV
jgi:dTDP-4-dehydrorhamnose reductase